MVSQTLLSSWRAAPPSFRRVPSAPGQASVNHRPTRIFYASWVEPGGPWPELDYTVDTQVVYCLLEEMPWSIRQPFRSQPSRLPGRQGNLEATGGSWDSHTVRFGSESVCEATPAIMPAFTPHSKSPVQGVCCKWRKTWWNLNFLQRPETSSKTKSKWG